MNSEISPLPADLASLAALPMGGDGQLPPGGLSVAIERDFGSFERWRAEFTALAQALRDGSAWLVLAWSPGDGRLVNHALAAGTPRPVASMPLLALDMRGPVDMDRGIDARYLVGGIDGWKAANLPTTAKP